MEPEEITQITSVRQLKEIRKKLKKHGNRKFSARIVDKRLAELQDKHQVQANHQATNRIIEFLKKAVK